MLSDGYVSHCIARDLDIDRLQGVVPNIFFFNQYQAEIESHPSTPLESCNSPKDAAYCIYTSGSTGKANGVLIQHESVIQLMINDPAELRPTSGDVWTIFHSFSFDFSVWEMYGALLFGGAAIIVPESIRKDPESFARLLCEEGVTILSQTPSYFYRLSEVLCTEQYPQIPVKHVIFGAEALRFSSLKQFKRSYPETRLINMYGITETTVHVTSYEVCEADLEWSSSNIGRPIPATTTYILDGKFRPVPIGLIGEIYVGGSRLAGGYLNRPDMTADRFGPDFISGYPGARLYRSGDLALYRDDGGMAYVGRKDHQVKLRGYRIEPREIEATLLKHETVRQCAVIVKDDGLGNKLLTAYVVGYKEGLPTVAGLREHLEKYLPGYMTPHAFVEMSELPVTANGKLDRNQLSAQMKPASVQNERVGTPIAEILGGIWEDVLGIERVGHQQNFFELGGHSLSATQVISRARKALQLEVPVRLLFESPTLAEFARAVESIRKVRNRDEAPPVAPVSRAADLPLFPLSFAQQRLWFIQ